MNYVTSLAVPLLSMIGVQVVAMASVWWLRSRVSFLRKFLGHAVSLAVGALLATAVLHLMPEAIEALGNRPAVWICFISTMVVLFAIERIGSALTGTPAETPGSDALSTVVHHHGHHTSKPMNLVFGGMLHSFVDGTALAAAFLVNPKVGMLAAVAITLHEIPHRLGDFALLMHLGMKPKRAMEMAMFVGAPALLGVLLVGAVGGSAASAATWMLPISAASFLYIATANLMPELQQECRLPRVLGQLAALIAGAGLVALFMGFAE